MNKLKPQYSLFPTWHCKICGVEVKEPITTCNDCIEIWLESIKLEGKSVFKKK